ncbi:cation-translocating P-type ATPase [Pedobacter sp. MC2016-24]|uniref:cation-translocating P-type ATPase n=1 Tax=Pedobacter sp. MC2016-24 TaxID=2780090 RepID=UPI001883093D|nr:cation-translocating P-type ATPase [Pedobacter sp. MC2016-24]MBE9600254.1 cation-translocating P-type ATPase [Pedobacter sp. MC2016-24]
MELFGIKGLNPEEVLTARKNYGLNKLIISSHPGWIQAVLSIFKEPMVILLLVTSMIYFIGGNRGDGLFLAMAIVVVSAISLFQESRSKNALAQLKELTEPKCKVIRAGLVKEIKTEELVIGDCLMVEEGTSAAADGKIIHSNDFSINESILTGESLAVSKDKLADDPFIYQGTTAVSGLAIAEVTAIGNQTKLGKIGQSLEDIKEEKTPLESQINNFVKKMVIAGLIIFLLVWAINYFHTYLFKDSLLKALTLAMSILPEEIPVAFTTFIALGAWKMMKMGIVVKNMKTVETLGSATVICTDKTGTLTQNRMSIAEVYTMSSNQVFKVEEAFGSKEKELLSTAMWASEPIPFDPMEIALHQAYSKVEPNDERPAFHMHHEYPLGGKPPMMTHVFENQQGKRIIAAKGAPEALIRVSKLSNQEKENLTEVMTSMATQGYRILGVAEAFFKGADFPLVQQDFKFSFKGLIAFYDPPKLNISTVLEKFYAAGIQVKIVTGDNVLTTTSIAKEIGFKGFDKSITGDELMQLSDKDLASSVSEIQLFARMFPEAKLRIINALKAKNEVVAMTGDGVNDGPALKAAHIGIAMGKKGTEIAKQAASLILIEDDLSKMVDAVAMGRRIYSNLKKAIRYIISIHIPIILTVFVPLALGWTYPNILSPVHIIFLELIMGPTCSIIYENEPMEKDLMIQKPRPFTTTFFNLNELLNSVVQGLVIAVGVLLVYQYAVGEQYDVFRTRTMVFTSLISANVFLTLVNRSFHYSLFTTLKYKNNLVTLMLGITVLLLILLLYVDPLTSFFEFKSLSRDQLMISSGVGFLSVIWYEFFKWIRTRRSGVGC